MVAAIGGSSLVAAASLQIKDARDHLLPVDGAIFIVITCRDRRTGLEKRTYQMAYVSPRAEDLVLSREAMECLRLVSDLDDSTAASVCHISSSSPSSGGGPSRSGSSDGGPGFPGCGDQQYKGVAGGLLTLDLIASHNQSYPDIQVSRGDLKPVIDPDFICRGTLALQNGMLTCGCFVREEAPEPITHKDILFIKVL